MRNNVESENRLGYAMKLLSALTLEIPVNIVRYKFGIPVNKFKKYVLRLIKGKCTFTHQMFELWRVTEAIIYCFSAKYKADLLFPLLCPGLYVKWIVCESRFSCFWINLGHFSPCALFITSFNKLEDPRQL